MIELDAEIIEDARVLVIGLTDEGKPSMSLQRPKFPGQTIEKMLAWRDNPDVLAIYLCLPSNLIQVRDK